MDRNVNDGTQITQKAQKNGAQITQKAQKKSTHNLLKEKKHL